MNRFVVVHNGRRDAYQVAIALYEAEHLEALVTDYYSKSGLVRRRWASGLQGARVINCWGALRKQAQGRLAPRVGQSEDSTWEYVESILGQTAKNVAVAHGSGILAYSGGTAWNAFRGFSGERVLFAFHPLAPKIREILIEDSLKFGLDGTTLQTEREFRDHGLDLSALDEVHAASRILVASSLTARSVQEATDSGSKSDVSVVPYGCPQITFNRRAPRATRFLFVGQGTQRKGIHHLLPAWDQATRNRTNAKLTMVMSVVDRSLLPSSVPSTVAIRSRVSNGELGALMGSHDVLVLPSLVEGFGLVITEALAQGMHVIASDNTGLVDLPVIEGASQLVPAGDVTALKHAIGVSLANSRTDYDASYESALRWQWRDFRNEVRSVLTK